MITFFAFAGMLIFTELVEGMTAFFLGWRGKKFWVSLLLINIITNPMLNCLLMVLNHFHVNSLSYVLILEAAVVLLEWKLFEYCLGKRQNKYFSLSLAINLSSYLLGVLYFGVF